MALAARLAELGLTLPKVAAPIASYVPFRRQGSLVFVSGQLPKGADGSIAKAHIGKVGTEVTLADAQEAARLCALNLLAAAQAAVREGSAETVKECVRLGVFVNSHAEFCDQPKVANGASELIVAALGEAGKHCRTAVSAPSLPLGVAVEIDGVFVVE